MSLISIQTQTNRFTADRQGELAAGWGWPVHRKARSPMGAEEEMGPAAQMGFQMPVEIQNLPGLPRLRLLQPASVP